MHDERQLAANYDAIVHEVYQAAAGLVPWVQPLQRVADLTDAWGVQLLGVEKNTGTMIFSYEAGPAPAEARLDYVRTYHRIDPRAGKVIALGVQDWIACQDEFDEQFVASSPFYQDYLIPYGARFLFGAKIAEDDASFILLGHLSRVGNLPLNQAERGVFAKIGEHVGHAFEIQRHLARLVDRNSLGFALLDRLQQPVILIDADRRITFKSDAAQAILEKREVIFDDNGILACSNSESDLDLTLALRDLALVPIHLNDKGESAERRSLRLRRRNGNQIVAGTLLALRPKDVMGAFGHSPQALLTIYEPGMAKDIDPFLLSTTFDLTPAEARVAARLSAGQPLEAIAREANVSISTVRSQLKAVFSKTGTNRQADLVRLLVAATAL